MLNKIFSDFILNGRIEKLNYYEKSANFPLKMTAEEQIRIVLVGNTGVGKTSIFNWYLRNIQETSPTVGASVQDVVVENDGKKINLNIWDTAGQLQFRDIMPLYFRDVNVIIICFSADNRESFDDITAWNNLIVDRAPKDAVKIMVCNKIDLEKDPIPQDKIDTMKYEISAAEVFRTSALTGEGIDLVFDFIINEKSIPRDKNYIKNGNDGNGAIPSNENPDNNNQSCC